MRRLSITAVLVLGIVVVCAGVASANPWPDWSAVGGTFSFTAQPTQTATGWDYTVNVDPTNAFPGWGIKAFVVYVDDVTTQPTDKYAYDGGNTAGFEGLNGGWEADKFPGPKGTTAAFGWQTGSNNLMSGHSAVFHAVNLPSGFQNFSQHFVVHAVPPGGANTFWTNGGTPPPPPVPEPGTLALLALGLGTVTGVVRRRKSA